MRYILAEYTDKGLKIPREVTAEVAQEAYERHCGPMQRMYNPSVPLPHVSTFTRPHCLSDEDFHDFLWVLVD